MSYDGNAGVAGMPGSVGIPMPVTHTITGEKFEVDGKSCTASEFQIVMLDEVIRTMMQDLQYRIRSGGDEVAALTAGLHNLLDIKEKLLKIKNAEAIISFPEED